MGSGGIIVADQVNCVIDTIKHFMEFNAEESCGKCTPCREGTTILYNMLDDITKGKSSMEELEKLKHLSKMVSTTSLCGLGQAAPAPIYSALEHFYDEFVDHIEHKICKTGVCKMSVVKGGE
jgi:NADH:ubiquinone oxidoreductase subunit F (NADH-binding)